MWQKAKEAYENYLDPKKGIHPEDVDALAATGATVARYEGADHGFVHDPSRPAHRADAATDAWERVVGWLSA